MKKTIYCFVGSLILLSFAVQAQEVDGLWLFPAKPGYNMTVVDGPANPPDEALGVSILGPDFTDWGIFYGINTGDTQNVAANLIPSITNSDMRARWTSSGLTGTLQIQSCTRNCPFAAGQTLQIVKEYGDGVYPPGDAPPPPTGGACAEDLCATDSALAQRCQSFLNTCLEQEADVNEDECLGGALLICRNLL
jgi:hypothetical protein